MSYRALLALALAVLLCAGAPASGVAQSPGDEQYQDPFGSDGGGQQQEPAEPAPTAEPAPVTPPVPETDPVAPADPAAEPAPTTPPTTPGAAGGSGELPRTGAPVWVVAAAGGALLGSGLVLRRRTGGARG
jgi:LPXTG-motif cell wall-anchored protein